MLLAGKVALVTGAGRGIGSSIATLFAGEGAAVAVHYRSSKENAEALARDIGSGAQAFGADLIDPVQTESLVNAVLSEYGRIDILVNNAAGFGPPKSFEETNWSDYREEFASVVAPTINACQHVVPQMRRQMHGRIITFGATLIQRPATEHIVHSTAKSALIGFTRTLARDVGRYGISVNMVSPGMTTTEYTNSLPEANRNSIAQATPMRRLATPEDAAKVVLFYASDLAAFVTSTNIAPDGGLTIL